MYWVRVHKGMEEGTRKEIKETGLVQGVDQYYKKDPLHQD